MKMNTSKEKRVTLVVFGIYCLLLTWLVLFKLSINIEEIVQMNMRNINLIPFQASMLVNGKLEISEIIYNILVFVPFGVYVQLFKPDWGTLKKILPGLFLSLVYEGIQYAFAIGASDITDVINNTCGAAIGIGLCILMEKLFHDKKIVVINMIGIVVEILALLLVILLAITNM